MIVRTYQERDKKDIVSLIAHFRVELANFKGITREMDLNKAKDELNDYKDGKFIIYVAADDNDELRGYAVCRISSGVAWADSLYVVPEPRRAGIGSSLYEAIESRASELGNDTVATTR
jgi:GNAT superfamily N-acetyltransferase